MHKLQLKIDTKIGELYLVGSAHSLFGVFWQRQNIALVTEADVMQMSLLSDAKQQILEYLDGQRKTFNLPLQPEGTAFQLRVWQQLQNIPYGKTCAYKDIAFALQNNGAHRAVGTANGRNPLSIIIPCHRVIAADGSLGGYAGTLPIKKMLLDIEQQSTL